MDTSALTQVYERSRRHMLAVASRYVGQEAEDLVQDAFVRALRHCSEFRYEAAPSTWLHRIVVNECISHHRTHRLRAQLRRSQPHQPHIANAGFAHTLAIRRALRTLRQPDYRVFVMYEVLGYTHPEIAEQLSIPLGTSKWRLTTARRTLKETLIGECHFE
ncbi:MAG: RNA polymerase sigma factor [Vicinamibacterales bacterium]